MKTYETWYEARVPANNWFAARHWLHVNFGRGGPDSRWRSSYDSKKTIYIRDKEDFLLFILRWS